MPDFALFCPICGFKQPELEAPAEPIPQEEVPSPVVEEPKTNEEQFAAVEGQAIEDLEQQGLPEESAEEPAKFGEPEDPGEAAASKKPVQGIEISPRVEEPKPEPVQTPAKPAPARKKGGVFIDPEPMKLLLILTGVLFLFSLAFWITGAFINVIIFGKLALMFFTLWRGFKVTWTMIQWLKAQKGKEMDMFTFLLLCCIAGITGLLIILNIIFMVG